MSEIQIQPSAISAYRVVTGSKKCDDTLAARIRDGFQGAVKIKPGKFYARGIVWISSGNSIVGCMRVNHRFHKAIFRAVRNGKSRCGNKTAQNYSEIIP